MPLTALRPVLADDFDLKRLAEIFTKKGKRGNTLWYGDLRHELTKDFPRITNDRQNDLLNYLEEIGFIERLKGKHGYFRLILPHEKKSKQEPQERDEVIPVITQEHPPMIPSSSETKKDGILTETILDYIKENPGRTTLEVATFVEREPSWISKKMKDLFEDGRIRRLQGLNEAGKGVKYTYYPKDSTEGELFSDNNKKKGEDRNGKSRILEYIQTHPDGATVEDIVAAANVSRPLIHLYAPKFIEQGLIRKETVGPKGAHKFFPASQQEGTMQTDTRLDQRIPLADRLVSFVRDNPATTGMDVAHEFQMSEEKAINFLNLTYLNNRLRRLRKQGPNGYQYEYYVPEHEAVKHLGPVTPVVPARTVGPSTKPAMSLAMEKAGLTPPQAPARAIQGTVETTQHHGLGAQLVYTIEVRVPVTRGINMDELLESIRERGEAELKDVQIQ